MFREAHWKKRRNTVRQLNRFDRSSVIHISIEWSLWSLASTSDVHFEHNSSRHWRLYENGYSIRTLFKRMCAYCLKLDIYAPVIELKVYAYLRRGSRDATDKEWEMKGRLLFGYSLHLYTAYNVHLHLIRKCTLWMYILLRVCLKRALYVYVYVLKVWSGQTHCTTHLLVHSYFPRNILVRFHS